MTRSDAPAEVAEYVEENREMLSQILAHSGDEFARACALAMLMRGGTKKDVDDVRRRLNRELDRIEEEVPV